MYKKIQLLIMLILSASILTADQLKIGSQAPGLIVVKDMNKESVDLRGRYLDGVKPLLINFFSVTCAPCRKEIPDIQRLHEKYGKAVNMILISIDRGRSDALRKQVSDFISGLGTDITMPVYISGADAASDFGGSSIALPSTYIIAKNGVIKNVILGYNESNIKKIEAVCAKPDKI